MSYVSPAATAALYFFSIDAVVFDDVENVRGVERHRQVERPILVAVDERLGLAGEQVGAVFVEFLRLAVSAQHRVMVVDERAGFDRAERLVKAPPLGRHRAGAVPLPDECGAVAGVAQHARQQGEIGGDAAAVVDKAEALLVAPGEEPRAGRAAERSGDVAGGELDAHGGQAVDVGGLHHVPEEATHVAAAEIVGDHDDDIGPRCWRLGVAGWVVAGWAQTVLSKTASATSRSRAKRRGSAGGHRASLEVKRDHASGRGHWREGHLGQEAILGATLARSASLHRHRVLFPGPCLRRRS